MIKGIGIDIEDLARFKHRPFSRYQSFYRKIFTAKEIHYCLSKARPYQHFAVRFCAKEALIKATGKTAANYTSIEVIMAGGRPAINLKKGKALVTLAHDRDKAVACVVIIQN